MTFSEGGSQAIGYPITVEFDLSERIDRWRPIVQWLLAIPHQIVLYFLGIVAYAIVIVSWFAGVISGKVPEDLLKILAMYQRYRLRVSSYSRFLRSEYPPFSFAGSLNDTGDDPRVRFDVAPSEVGRNRLTIFFRLLMAIPNAIVFIFVAIAAQVVTFVAWFAVIILGRWPDGMRRFITGYLRWNSRLTAYMLLLTDEYPPFNTR